VHANAPTHAQRGLIKISLEPPLSSPLCPSLPILYVIRLSLGERLSIRGDARQPRCGLPPNNGARSDPLNGQLTSGSWRVTSARSLTRKEEATGKIRSRSRPNFRDRTLPTKVISAFIPLKRGDPSRDPIARFFTRSEIEYTWKAPHENHASFFNCAL